MQPAFAFHEAFLPIRITLHTILMVPERLENKPIVDQQSYRPGELLPDRLIDQLVGVE